MIFNQDIKEVLEQYTVSYVATAAKNGMPNVSLKGIIKFDAEEGIIYFLDLFCQNTEKNLKENRKIALAVVDHKNFKGFQFKGTAELIDSGVEFEQCKNEWHISKHNRFRERVNHNIRELFKDTASELDLPEPKYLVKIKVEEIIDLAAFKK